MNVHVSLVMHPDATGEPKTKPMQNSVSCPDAMSFGCLISAATYALYRYDIYGQLASCRIF